MTVVGHRTKHPRTVRIDSSAHSTHEQSVSKCVSKPSTPRIVHVLAPGRRSKNRADWLQTSHQLVTSRSTLHYITLHHITSHHITSHHITSHHITSHHITSHHITSHHITSHHITLHYITHFGVFLKFFFAYTSSRGSIICRLVRPSVFRRPDSLVIKVFILF